MRIEVMGASGGVALAVAAMTVGVVLHSDAGGRDANHADADLPVWFGDVSQPLQRIAGHVFGATSSTIVRVLPDIPDLSIAHERLVVVNASGDFDAGPMRAGRYVVLATGFNAVSHLTHIDTLAQSATKTALPEQVELFVYARADVVARVGDLSSQYSLDWSLALRIANGEPARFERSPTRLPRTLLWGDVRHEDGTVATDVAVQPLSCFHSDMEPLPTIVTSVGGAPFIVPVSGADVCALRIWNGVQIHDVKLDSFSGQFEVRLPPRGEEHVSTLSPYRLAERDHRRRWIRGRVVRGGRRVGDAKVTATVWSACTGREDQTWSRIDGSFELQVLTEISINDHVIVDVDQDVFGLHGSQELAIPAGQGVDGDVVEIGAGVRVSGRVVDGQGVPVPHIGVMRGQNYLGVVQTDAAGRFVFVAPRQGHVPLDLVVNRVPVRSDPPAIEIPSPDGEVNNLELRLDARGVP